MFTLYRSIRSFSNQHPFFSALIMSVCVATLFTQPSVWLTGLVIATIFYIVAATRGDAETVTA